MEQIKQLNEWKELLDDRVASLKRSIVAMRAELESRGASEQYIDAALCHEYEMLDKIFNEDYPCLQAEMNHLYSGAVSNVASHQMPVEYPSRMSRIAPIKKDIQLVEESL